MSFDQSNLVTYDNELWSLGNKTTKASCITTMQDDTWTIEVGKTFWYQKIQKVCRRRAWWEFTLSSSYPCISYTLSYLVYLPSYWQPKSSNLRQTVFRCWLLGSKRMTFAPTIGGLNSFLVIEFTSWFPRSSCLFLR